MAIRMNKGSDMRKRSERGASLIEAALLMSVLAVVAIGSIRPAGERATVKLAVAGLAVRGDVDLAMQFSGGGSEGTGLTEIVPILRQSQTLPD